MKVYNIVIEQVDKRLVDIDVEAESAAEAYDLVHTRIKYLASKYPNSNTKNNITKVNIKD